MNLYVPKRLDNSFHTCYLILKQFNLAEKDSYADAWQCIVVLCFISFEFREVIL